MRVHHAVEAARVRRWLGEAGVLTTVQLYRAGLLTAARRLGAAETTLSCRTRVTQTGSTVDLTFVALDPARLQASAQALAHDVGLTELCLRRGELRAGERLVRVRPQGRARGNLPDAELLSGDLMHAQDTALEYDAGYPEERVKEKLLAFEEAGYVRVAWGTSVRSRVESVQRLVSGLRGRRALLNVDVETHHVDFWSAHQDPYAPTAGRRRSG